MKKITKILGIMAVMTACTIFAGAKAEAKTYTIGTKTAPCSSAYRRKPYYNKNTKNYYTIQSYLAKMGKKGGTLKLKKGTYKIPCTIYVPSNVTIKCSKGVKLKKTTKTGTSKLKSSKFMFQLLPEGKSGLKRAVAGYKASKNVKITGSGTVIFDLGKVSEATGIYAGHASGITISGIQFKNKKGGSYIWVEGSKNVSITKCKFMAGAAKSGLKNRFGIRLENISPDTNGFSGKWSKLDNTVNKKITISGNTFRGQNYAVGTSKNTTAKNAKGETVVYYQTGIKIKDNTFTDTEKYAVYAVDWKTPSITGNAMNIKSAGKKSNCLVKGFGVYNPSIQKNTVSSAHYAFLFDAAKNSGKGSALPANKSVLESSCLDKMQDNTLSGLSHYYVTNEGVQILFFRNKTDKNFTITTTTDPYHEKYMKNSDYSKRKVYYIFTSYMEQLEYAGGGTITVEPGVYQVSNNICIPSNVTLNLKDGVVFRKIGTTATDICYAKTLFTIVPPSLDGTKGTVSGYNGSHDVKILGTGTVQFDCVNVLNTMTLAMGGAKNITISGITFMNEYGSHFIELNSSNNVTIENCSFIGFKPYDLKSYKECINVDGNDLVTDGFNYDWSAHDKTTCRDIFIRNNTFTNVGTAVGSHTYSCSGTAQLYHENVQITGNTVNGTYNSAIRALNWKDCVIKNNTFQNIQSLSDGNWNANGEQTRYVGLLLRGVLNPVVTENTFDTMEYYPIRVVLSYSTGLEAAVKAGYPDTVSSISDANWAAMQNNTLLNISKAKYKNIVIRADDDQKDSEAEKKAFEPAD